MSTALKASLATRLDVKRVLLDCDSVDFIDISAGDELLGLVKELQKAGIAVGFVRVRDAVRDDMRKAGIETAVGPPNFFERTTDGVRAWQQQSPPEA
ncbi:sodium-independent anion transporter [Rhizobium sp. RHZ02]|uniref:sodium-independent anion transporter n=1 Tax=unclassified Rhizobium TaxID=2613769 RepID=UPI0028A89391|nr:sodium-independent anion transporter [Rhizobium sp. RHZ02]NMN71416.1 Sulfate permease and related transporters (MFS superfamily) [Rhizobium sp. 57MFTsu3.2]